MDAAEFHERLARLGFKQHEAANKLGLSPAGLSRQLRGHRPVSRQTEMLLEGLERERQHSGGFTDPGGGP
jgi:predicted transcriptional regulator